MLEVREQIALSFRRLLGICLDSISYRLLRSMVTAFIIVVAIAFLAVIMIEGYLGRATRNTVRAHTDRFAACSRFLREVTHAPPRARLVSLAARAAAGSATVRNLAAWGGMGEDGARAFCAMSARVEAYLRFFDTIPVGRRVLLVGQSTGLAIFDRLQEGRQFADFSKALEPMRSLKIPGSFEAFETFLQAWPEYRDRLQRVSEGCADMTQKVQAACAPAGVQARLLEAAKSDTVAEFFASLAALQCHVDAARIPEILESLRVQEEIDWALGQLGHPTISRTWNREFRETFGPRRALGSCALFPERIAWIQKTLAEEKADAGFDAARFAAIAHAYHVQEGLLQSGQELAGRYGEVEGLSERAIWLMLVSFLVCVVGIANAMLMSVLERFKEIATMKCLGARNNTIAFLFITESLILGGIGGAIGVMAGFTIALARQVWAYRGLVFEQFPGADVLFAFAVCFVCSLFLTAAASVYPARVAARMAPMEAMRVD